MRKKHGIIELEFNLQTKQIFNSVYSPFSLFSLDVKPSLFRSDAIWELYEEVKRKTKKQILYLLVYNTMLPYENSHSIPAFTNTTVSQIYAIEFEWNKRSSLTPFFLI